MIRKCGRLARAWGASKPGIGTMFRTVHAPADFRLKEMEKWIRYQENGGPISIKSTHTVDAPLSRRSSSNSVHRRSSFCCSRCASTTQPHVDHLTSTLHRKLSLTHSNRGPWTNTGLKSKRSLSNIPRRSSTPSIQSIRIENGGQTYSIYRAVEAEGNDQNIHEVLEPYADKRSGRPSTRRRSAVFSTEEAPLVDSPRVLSPDPLPHPYRPRHSEPIVTGGEYDSSNTDNGDPTEGSLTRPPLLHRRSSLKQSIGSLRASMDATKSVAWAMDQDWQEQIKKYEEAAVDAEAAGELIYRVFTYLDTNSRTIDRDWKTTRATYEEEMAGMRVMRQNISSTLARLRSETERLEKENEVMKEQEYKLNENYRQLEQSQLQYRAKGEPVSDTMHLDIDWLTQFHSSNSFGGDEEGAFHSS